MARFGTLLWVSFFLALVARADDAKQVFDSLYAQKIKQASTTADRADDIALAKEMLTVAKSSGSTPRLQALLCDAAGDLAGKHPDGFSIAIEAIRLLADTQEHHRDAARTKLIDLLTKQSRTGKLDERAAAADGLIDLLVNMGDEKLKQKRYPEAISDFRRANATAIQYKSDFLDDIKVKLETATTQERVKKELEDLRSLLLKDPSDVAIAEKIIQLCVILDDVALAASHVKFAKDEKLKKFIQLAGTPVPELTATDAAALAEWYFSLGRDRRNLSQKLLWQRAGMLFDSALASTSLDSLTRQQAIIRLEELRRTFPDNPDGQKVIFDFFKSFEDAKVAGLETKGYWKQTSVQVAQNSMPAIQQFPPVGGDGVIDATFRVNLPKRALGTTTVFKFGTAVTAPTADGVKFLVLINGKELWSLPQDQSIKLGHSVDLKDYAGMTVSITLRVDRVGNNANDHAKWIEPMVVRRSRD